MMGKQIDKLTLASPGYVGEISGSTQGSRKTRLALYEQSEWESEPLGIAPPT
jgi:hypothetical protein